MTDFFDTESAPKMISGIQAAFDQGHAIVKANHIDTHGKRTEFEYSLAQLNPSSKNRPCICGIGRDLTEIKAAEQERIERLKLQAVVETAGAVCHEFNQPLQIIAGISELLLDEGGTAENLDNHRGTLKDLIAQIHRLGGISRKLMKITRYETCAYIGNQQIIDLDKASEDGDRHLLSARDRTPA